MLTLNLQSPWQNLTTLLGRWSFHQSVYDYETIAMFERRTIWTTSQLIRWINHKEASLLGDKLNK